MAIFALSTRSIFSVVARKSARKEFVSHGVRSLSNPADYICSTSTGAPQKHEISLNISGDVTLGHSQGIGDEMVKLREGVEAILDDARTVHGVIAKVREGMDANRNEAQALRDEMSKLNSQLELLNSKLDFQTKLQNLAFAVQNVEANSFNCYAHHQGWESKSSDLVRWALLIFRRGGSYARMPSKTGRMDRFAQDNELLKSEQVFRDKLSHQIHQLTGVKPRFVLTKEGGDTCLIYYS